MSLSSLNRDMKEIKNEMNSHLYLQDSFSYQAKDIQNNSHIFEGSPPPRPGTKSNRSNSHNSSHSGRPESNLGTKIQESVQHQNWNEAFSLAIANSSNEALLELLKFNKIPDDGLVQDCLVVELRRNLDNWTVLKWLLSYLQHVDVDPEKVHKLSIELSRAQGSASYSPEDMRQYAMYKALLMEEIRNQIVHRGASRGN